MMVIVYIQSRRGVIHYGLNGMGSSWAVNKGHASTARAFWSKNCRCR